MIVAQTAGYGRPSRQILFNKGPHHVLLKALLMIDHIVGDIERLGDAAGVIDIINRTAASADMLRHAFVAGKPPLVPELHRQSDNGVPLGAQHGCDSGGIHPARHSYRDGL